VVDPEQHPEPCEPVLSQAFGLSRSEVRVALELLRGRELREIAQAHGTTLGTVRSQLKSIYAKTETHRQAELVSLLGRMARPIH
jgi:DNA-binding CsgD family transcriptional regulator